MPHLDTDTQLRWASLRAFTAISSARSRLLDSPWLNIAAYVVARIVLRHGVRHGSNRSGLRRGIKDLQIVSIHTTNGAILPESELERR